MGGIVKGLFGGGEPPAPVVIPPTPTPTPTPMPDQEALAREAKRKAARAAASRGGRLSTALSAAAGEDDKLGG